MQSKHSETRQSWTYQEDKLLLELIKLNGCSSWNRIALELQSQVKNSSKIRSPAACRERYQNILNPNLNKSNWTEEEEQLLFNLQQSFGNSWARIASQMPGRSDLLCKNYFYATLRKVLRRLSKAVGLDQSSDLLKQIKPSVLGVIYCSDDSFKSFNIDEEVKKGFQKMIKQYRHTEKSELRMLSDENIDYIKTMLNKLFAINNNYVSQKSGSQKNKTKQDLNSQENSKSINDNQLPQKNQKENSKNHKEESKLDIITHKQSCSEEIQNTQTPSIQKEEQTFIQPPQNQMPSNIYSYSQYQSQYVPMYPHQPVVAFYIQPNLNFWQIQPVQPFGAPQCIPNPQTYPYIQYEYSQMI